MIKIGIYGGTFNPVHIGHINLLKRFCETIGFDKTIVIPTNIPPHKSVNMTADGETRLQMCREAFNFCNAEVSTIELNRPEKSYSYDTVVELKKMYPDPENEFYFLMGSDMFLSLETWNRYDKLKEMVTFCAAARNAEDRTKLEKHAEKLTAGGAKTVIVDIDITDISSAQIRERVMFGEPFSEYVPKCVENIIAEKKLYSFDRAVDFCKSAIRPRLEDNRYHHSLCVADSAKQLAQKYGANPQKAYIAGLLHDITKQTSQEEQLQLIEKFDILCEDVEFDNKALWHAASGFAFVKYVLGFHDEDLLNSIRYHTTSREKASLLEDVLYIADFISADRSYPDVDVIREKAEKSLNDAKMYGLSYTIADNVRKSRKIGLNTVKAYNSLLTENR